MTNPAYQRNVLTVNTVGRNTQQYGWLLPMRSKQIELAAFTTEGEGRVAEYDCWGLESKCPFSVWRWVGDEGRFLSIMDDSSSALTFNTWIYLYTAALQQGEFKNMLYAAQRGGERVCSGFLCFCTVRVRHGNGRRVFLCMQTYKTHLLVANVRSSLQHPASI